MTVRMPPIAGRAGGETVQNDYYNHEQLLLNRKHALFIQGKEEIERDTMLHAIWQHQRSSCDTTQTPPNVRLWLTIPLATNHVDITSEGGLSALLDVRVDFSFLPSGMLTTITGKQTQSFQDSNSYMFAPAVRYTVLDLDEC